MAFKFSSQVIKNNMTLITWLQLYLYIYIYEKKKQYLPYFEKPTIVFSI